jgi:hypothetical protein
LVSASADEEQEASVSDENGTSGEGEQDDAVIPDTASGSASADGKQKAQVHVENGSSGENPSNVPSEATQL